MFRTMLAAFAILVSSAAAEATTFNVSGEGPNGSTVTGSIEIDTVAGTLDDFTFTVASVTTVPPLTDTYYYLVTSNDIGPWRGTTRNSTETFDFNFALLGTEGGLIGYSGGTLVGNLWNLETNEGVDEVLAGTVSAVPLPASGLLLFGAIAALALVRRRQAAC